MSKETRLKTLEHAVGIGPDLEAEIEALLKLFDDDEAEALLKEFAQTLVSTTKDPQQ